MQKQELVGEFKFLHRKLFDYFNFTDINPTFEFVVGLSIHLEIRILVISATLTYYILLCILLLCLYLFVF